MSSSSDDGDIMEKQNLNDLSQMKPVKNMDDFIKLGWYCTRVLSASEFMTLTALSSMVYMVYAGISPTVIGCGSISFNSTEYACENLSAVRLQTNCTPQLEYQFYSVNVEFDLLCDDSKLVKNSISIQMIGVLIGALIAGQLSDLYGRRTILICSLLGFAAFSLGTSLTTSFIQFTMLRAIVGFFTGGLSAVQGVFLIENVPVRHRMWINTVITWSPNFIIFPMIAYLCGDWRTLAGVSAVISLVAAVNLWYAIKPISYYFFPLHIALTIVLILIFSTIYFALFEFARHLLIRESSLDDSQWSNQQSSCCPGKNQENKSRHLRDGSG
uniref:MFS domain-containing protein n=1 Tax=Heterorhabditis bacteriophora TaxID=37862 RepID=A0A1I7XIX6_HETBA